ncbi:SET domain-containing protein 4-like [Diadema antillarum]|uniref:SET domain-containing protein 4-like n=1 Tax=Diadema antillarum TaxID=105358 RepID=UPI003A88E106
MWRRRLKKKRERVTRNSRIVCLDHEEDFILLMKWLKQNGFRSRDCHLKPACLPETGRGLVTTRKLKAGDTLLEIPCHLLITAQSILETELGSVIKRQTRKPTPQQVMCTFLLTERSKGNASFWYPYINVLPTHFTTPACCFRDRSVSSYLPEPVKTQFLHQYQRIQSAFSNATQLFEDVERTFPQYHGLFDFSSFLWAWFVINSRSVYIEPGDCEYLDPSVKDQCALAPFLDLLNHSPTADICAGLDLDANCYRITTQDRYDAFSQVFIHYGPHDNAALLLEYGFVIPENPHDVVFFSLDAVMDAVKWVRGKHGQMAQNSGNSMWERKAAILESESMHKDLSCSQEGPSWALRMALRVLCMDYQELRSWKRMIGGEGAIMSSSRLLISLALQKLTDDAIEEVLSKLKTFHHPSEVSEEYLQPIKLLWEERLKILHATEAVIQT